ncbi:MAG: helix-turn-helix domain-containing protein [Gammaproteobacteria bacterium]|nr:helix-turn-helix domain-containing protein [Gammaproteobacteria bacterium]
MDAPPSTPLGWIRWARDKRLGGKLQTVLVGIALRANEDGECWPNQETIGANVGVHRVTVCNAAKELERLGLLTIENRHKSAKGRTSNVYRLTGM